MVSGPITLWQIDGETMETLTDFILEGSQITADGDCSHEIKKKKFLLLGKNFMTNLDSTLKKQRHYFGNKVSPSEGYGFSCSHVWLWELDQKEGWVSKNCYFPTVILEKILESPLIRFFLENISCRYTQICLLGCLPNSGLLPKSCFYFKSWVHLYLPFSQ